MKSDAQMRPIPIAFCIDTIEAPSGGTENQLLLLIRNIDRTRFSPILCVLYSSAWLQTQFNLCPVYEVGTKSPLRPSSWTKIFRLSRFLRQRGVRIVQTFFRDANIAGILAARFAFVPIIISSRRNKGHWHTGFELALLRCLNLFVTSFLANSEDVKQYTNQAEGIPLNRIDVIYNGFDFKGISAMTPEMKSKFRKSLDIPGDALVISAVANLRPVKGLDILVQSLQRVISAFSNVVVLLVGEGSERSNLAKQIQSLGLDNTVRFMGTRKDIPDILQASDLGVLSSHSEGLSNAIIEYMACGLPVVATDVGGNHELVIPGENGYLVPPGNPGALSEALIQLLQDSELRHSLGMNSLNLVKDKFNLSVYIQAHERYYWGLINRVAIIAPEG
ncbi:MAG: glycosyltransferase [Deltaproteobacteria bacterium]